MKLAILEKTLAIVRMIAEYQQLWKNLTRCVMMARTMIATVLSIAWIVTVQLTLPVAVMITVFARWAKTAIIVPMIVY
jgi:hypothetical protein